jgi:hypothetical protein
MSLFVVARLSVANALDPFQQFGHSREYRREAKQEFAHSVPVHIVTTTSRETPFQGSPLINLIAFSTALSMLT